MLTSLSYGQKSSPYLFEKKTLQEVAELERNLNSDSLGFKKRKFSFNAIRGIEAGKTYYPLQYQRTEMSFQPACIVNYFYSEKDSIVIGVYYSWNKKNDIGEYSDVEYVFGEEIKRKEEYLNQYNQVRQELLTMLGNPYRTTDIKEYNNRWQGTTKWQKDGKIITLLFAFTSGLAKIQDYKSAVFAVQLTCDIQNQ